MVRPFHFAKQFGTIRDKDMSGKQTFANDRCGSLAPGNGRYRMGSRLKGRPNIQVRSKRSLDAAGSM